MKSSTYVFVLSFLLICQSLFAQSSPDGVSTLTGFWGMRFGSSQAECKRLLLSKEGAKIDTKNSNADRLILEGLRFAGRPVSFIRVSFFRDQFHTASIYYKPSLDAKTQELFDNIKTELNGKYFVTNSDYRLFKSPYSDGDGYEMSAVRQGLGTISAYWIFDRPDGYQNVISLKIDEDLYVVLAYQDGCLIKEQIEADKAKNVRDY